MDYAYDTAILPTLSIVTRKHESTVLESILIQFINFRILVIRLQIYIYCGYCVTVFLHFGIFNVDGTQVEHCVPTRK